MVRAFSAAILGLALVGIARAEGPLQYKPIDTSKFLVQPTDQATGFLSNVTRTLSRFTAVSIEQNGFVRTLNNLFGREGQPDPRQNGFSALPPPSAYPSTSYSSPLKQVMPVARPRR